MEPTPAQIPPRLLGDLRTSSSLLRERLESSPGTEDAFSKPNELLSELKTLTLQAGEIAKRFGPRDLRDPSKIEADSPIGKILALQAGAQSFAVSLMVSASNLGAPNSTSLYTSARLLFLQSCERIQSM